MVRWLAEELPRHALLEKHKNKVRENDAGTEAAQARESPLEVASAGGHLGVVTYLLRYSPLLSLTPTAKPEHGDLKHLDQVDEVRGFNDHFNLTVTVLMPLDVLIAPFSLPNSLPNRRCTWARRL
eukprot:SAG31_NODE_1696_length_7503_cov_45.737574_5_plen_125_part_00